LGSPAREKHQQNGAEFAEKCQAICNEHGSIFEAESRSVESLAKRPLLGCQSFGKIRACSISSPNPRRIARAFAAAA
jgi:hypothetical protein